jgi:hypothetical protein
MKLIRLVVASALMINTEAILAQSANDAVSGTWTGHIGPGATPQMAVTLELKFDGKNAVTGTLSGLSAPGDVKKGTFDPATGALKLELGETGNANVLLVLEGTVVLGSATGRGVTPDGQTGTFRFNKGSTAAPKQPNDAVAVARGGFAEVSAWVTKAAETVPADKYTYRPVQTVRTFGQLIGHIADSYNWYCANAAGRKVEWADPVEKGPTDKATLATKLKQATDACNAVYTDKGVFMPMVQNVGHTNLHYGNIITYMRMMGLTPPSS